MKDKKSLKNFVEKTLIEANVVNLGPKELEQAYSDTVAVSALRALTLGEIVDKSQRMNPPIPNPFETPVYFRSEGFHMKAGTLQYIEPPPESGKKPYFLLNL